MVTTVIATTQVEGFHLWRDHAYGKGFLAARHRHIFNIKVEFAVSHDDRDIEFIEAGREVKVYLERSFGTPCEFGEMSCEMIAKEIITKFAKARSLEGRIVSCEVWEDNENGARVQAK